MPTTRSPGSLALVRPFPSARAEQRGAAFGRSQPAPVAAAKPAPVAAAKPAPRFPDKLVVRMEKKGRRGKTVTRVSGVPARDLAALCKEMKKALGCGATIEDADLILLGDLVDRAAKWLEKAGAAKLVRGT